MIPILYSVSETSFTSEGLGRFAEAISCNVVEQRNGSYELTMVYPADGNLYSLIDTSMFIFAKPNDTSNPQAFRIYKITTPLNGKVTIYAQHISYDLSGIPVIPFKSTGIIATLNGIKNNSAIANGFTFTTDVTNTTTAYEVTVPASARACLGGIEGSVLDMFSGPDFGEFEWDMKTVKFLGHRGTNNGVTIAYGKNMIDLNKEKSEETLYTGVMAYWTDSENGTVVRSAIQYVNNHASYPVEKIFIMDATSDFETQPTVEQLNRRAITYRDANDVGVPRVNVKVSFVPLWQSEEYKNLAPLERVSLCDTVTVYYAKYGVNATAKVIETDYDVLKERYNSITLGDAKSRLGETIQQKISETVTTQAQRTTSFLEQAIENATNLITGGDGGYVVISQDEDGRPYEILIMDNEDKTQAVNVIRMNQNGIGFSNNGYNGPFTTAWTIDGGFVADFIKSGTIDAIQINGSNIDGSVITFGSDTEKTVMQTEVVTNTIDNPIASITTQYPAAVIRGEGVEIHGDKVVSLKGEDEFNGLTYNTEVHVSPYQAYLQAWWSSPTANPQFSRVMVQEDLVELMGRRTNIAGQLWRLPSVGSIYQRPLFYLPRQFVSRQSNYVTAGTCHYTIIGDMCFLTFENLTFANLDHYNTLTDVAFWNVPRAKYGVNFVVNTYGESTHVCYGHRLRVNDDHVYFQYDRASEYTSWQFYGSVWYALADNVGINDDGTFTVY